MKGQTKQDILKSIFKCALSPSTYMLPAEQERHNYKYYNVNTSSSL